MYKKEKQERSSKAEQKLLMHGVAQMISHVYAMPQALEQIIQAGSEQESRIVRLEQMQLAHNQNLQDVESSLQKLATGLDAFYQQSQCLQQASDRLSLLSEQHYQQHVIEPLARRVFPLLDMYEEALSNDKQSDLLDAFAADLYELLAGFGVEPILMSVGDAFNPSTMQPMQTVFTQQRKSDKTVASVVRQGFCCQSRILRTAKVALYRFDRSRRVSIVKTEEGANEL